MKSDDESREAVARMIFEEIDAPLVDSVGSWQKAAAWDRDDLTCLPAAELRNRCLAAVDRLRAAGIIIVTLPIQKISHWQLVLRYLRALFR